MAQIYQATVQYSACRPRYPNIASFDRNNGECCGMDKLTQCVYKKIHSRNFVICIGETVMVSPFRHRIRDCVVQAAVKCSKFLNLDPRAVFESPIRYRLAQITVVANNLLNRVSLPG